ncbi:App1 family protein [Gramella sp. GC03-9]|uniref:App1 family protein n=1 Tax=Christiangramia oceanisediminis TaxID=2920386 RepID=A0A9X2I623_9FLAO|nr:App1 family protein [Gramella oceanisediminis]MCP9200072.1 App1 family protein [Gramella oceanisediminis]
MKLDLKLYRGYVNNEELVVFGHLFESWAPDKYSVDKKGVKHAYSILHKFRIKPLQNYEVRLKFREMEVTTKTMDDGYFRFSVPFEEELEPGWHEYEVSCRMFDFGIIEKGELLKPYESKLAIISDIDDTFLISHSNSFFKKLYVMLSKNINKRKVFDDVVRHYQKLSLAGQDDNSKASNSFFFVSSSEWNLYDFISEFAHLHELPKAVIKLKKIKTGLRDFVKSGRGDHDHKFIKIKDIISFYPHLKYVLLGDDSQHDPYLYERICKTFPVNIRAVYIRQTSSKQNKKVKNVLSNLNDMGVSTCYFRDSDKAINHSAEHGII